MGHKGEVVCFLHRTGRQHGPAGGAGMHHVRVVAKDGKGMGGDGSRGYVDHRRRQFAGDLEHVGHHQKKALRRRKRRSQGTFLQGAVKGTRGARLGLHLDDVGYLPPEVCFPRRGPIVRQLAHSRGRSYRIDSDHFGQGISHTGRAFVTVHT